MQKFKNSFNEYLEKELFLLSTANFSIEAINAMTTIDFDLYYAKVLTQKQKELEQMKKINNQNNQNRFTYE